MNICDETRRQTKHFAKYSNEYLDNATINTRFENRFILMVRKKNGLTNLLFISLSSVKDSMKSSLNRTIFGCNSLERFGEFFSLKIIRLNSTILATGLDSIGMLIRKKIIVHRRPLSQTAVIIITSNAGNDRK